MEFRSVSQSAGEKDARNRFYPLRDREGPSKHGSNGYERASQIQELYKLGPSRDVPPGQYKNNPGEHWGFPRPSQGLKRPVENKEGAEGGGEQSLKKV